MTNPEAAVAADGGWSLASRLSGQIQLPNAPLIAGLVFRELAGAADYSALAELIGVCRTDEVAAPTTAAEIADQFAPAHGIGGPPTLLLAEIAGQVIGFSRMGWRDQHGATLAGMLHPVWRGQGIAEAMRRFHEAAQRSLGAAVIRTVGDGLDAADQAGLRQAGYIQGNSHYDLARDLTAPIEPAALPPGCETRLPGRKTAQAVWAGTDPALRRHWENNFARWQASSLCQPKLWQVGWAGDNVIGSVLNFIPLRDPHALRKRQGYTQSISVAPAWRRRGVARALLTRSLHMFQAMGLATALLSVTADDPAGALALYASVGFKIVCQRDHYHKQLQC